MDQLNWDDLRFVRAVAEAGSVRKGASQLKVSHQTVARRIASLEAKLGTTLFLRTTEGYLLTPAAEEIVRAAEEVEDVIGNAARRAMAESLRPAGVVRVGILDSIMPFLAEPFAAFCETYPEIAIEVVEAGQLVDFSKRQADVALRSTDKPPNELVGRRLAAFRTAIYASPKYLKRAPRRRPLEDHVWIGWDAPRDRARPAQWMQQQVPKATIAARVSSFSSLIHLIREGVGVGILACAVGDQEPDLVRVRSNPIEEIDVSLWILTHPDLRRSARIRAFMDFVSERIVRHRPLLEGKCPRTVKG